MSFNAFDRQIIRNSNTSLLGLCDMIPSSDISQYSLLAMDPQGDRQQDESRLRQHEVVDLLEAQQGASSSAIEHQEAQEEPVLQTQIHLHEWARDSRSHGPDPEEIESPSHNRAIRAIQEYQINSRPQPDVNCRSTAQFDESSPQVERKVSSKIAEDEELRVERDANKPNEQIIEESRQRQEEMVQESQIQQTNSILFNLHEGDNLIQMQRLSSTDAHTDPNRIYHNSISSLPIESNVHSANYLPLHQNPINPNQNSQPYSDTQLQAMVASDHSLNNSEPSPQNQTSVINKPSNNFAQASNAPNKGKQKVNFHYRPQKQQPSQPVQPLQQPQPSQPLQPLQQPQPSQPLQLVQPVQPLQEYPFVAQGQHSFQHPLQYVSPSPRSWLPTSFLHLQLQHSQNSQGIHIQRPFVSNLSTNLTTPFQISIDQPTLPLRIHINVPSATNTIDQSTQTQNLNEANQADPPAQNTNQATKRPKNGISVISKKENKK